MHVKVNICIHIFILHVRSYAAVQAIHAYIQKLIAERKYENERHSVHKQDLNMIAYLHVSSIDRDIHDIGDPLYKIFWALSE